MFSNKVKELFSNSKNQISDKQLISNMFHTPSIQDVNSTYIRRSEDVLDVFWTSYVRSIYVLCLLASHTWKEKRLIQFSILFLSKKIKANILGNQKNFGSFNSL